MWTMQFLHLKKYFKKTYSNKRDYPGFMTYNVISQ